MDVFADSDWAGNPRDRKSVSGGILMLGRHQLESWSSGQQVIALSSGEAEFYASGNLAAHMLNFLYLIGETGEGQGEGLAVTEEAHAHRRQRRRREWWR